MISILSLLAFFSLLVLWDWLVNKDYYETNYVMLPYIPNLYTPNRKLKAVWTKEKPFYLKKMSSTEIQKIRQEIIAEWRKNVLD